MSALKLFQQSIVEKVDKLLCKADVKLCKLVENKVSQKISKKVKKGVDSTGKAWYYN